MSGIPLARQPILNHEQSVVGYDIVHAITAVNGWPGPGADEPDRAALDRVLEIGVGPLTGASRAWVTLGSTEADVEKALRLPADRVVLEFRCPSGGRVPSVEQLEELRDAGYKLALKDFEYEAGLEPLLDVINYVKLDMATIGARAVARNAFEVGPHHLKLVATGVGTQEDFKLAGAAGADLYQGYFFCQPLLLSGRAIAPSRIAMLQLASALQDPGIQLTELERLISGDVALSYRLLKYINSAYFSLRGEISSIKQAVALLGIEPLRRWATLTIFSEVGDKPRELFVTALIRARFCQETGSGRDGSSGELFTLGLFSVLDAVTDTTMYAALASLPLTASLREALIDHTGPGRLLDCVRSIEAGEFEQAHGMIAGSPEHYLDAVLWSNEAARMLVG